MSESALGDLLDCSNWPSRLTGPERLDRRIDRTRQLYQRFHKTMAASLFSNFMRFDPTLTAAGTGQVAVRVVDT